MARGRFFRRKKRTSRRRRRQQSRIGLAIAIGLVILVGVSIVAFQLTREVVAPQSDARASESPAEGSSGERLAKADGSTTSAGVARSDYQIITTGFSGRYRWGPDESPVRMVLFTDYQCPVCRAVEAQIEQVLERWDNVQFSVKHFPLCEDCNKYFKAKNKHPNACNAARLVEAAGILKDLDGFKEMHAWLFERGGEFTDATLIIEMRQRGYDPVELIEVMNSDETLRRVESDIEEAIRLGIQSTPQLYINGVELKGIHADRSVVRAVEQLMEADLAAAPATADQPQPASERFVEQWRAALPRGFSEDPHPRRLGAESPKIDILLWGDFQDRPTAVADVAIRELVAARDDVRYSFRVFPINGACNPVVRSSDHPLACFAARAAEAFHDLKGDEGYWQMHDWLMRHRRDLNDVSLRQKAIEVGVNAGALREAMDADQIATRIREDAGAGVDVGLSRVPLLFINGREVPRFYGGAEAIIGAIVEAAANGGVEAP